jgi:hypothetical protein
MPEKVEEVSSDLTAERFLWMIFASAMTLIGVW